MSVGTASRAYADADACTVRAGEGGFFTGDVSQSALDAQMDALNAALAPTPFQLTVADIDYTSNVSVRFIRWQPGVLGLAS